ncbi:MAG: cellulase family glycosylhydrolase, partial [Byssovorax sp.]
MLSRHLLPVLVTFGLGACSQAPETPPTPPTPPGPSGPPCAEARFAAGRASTQCAQLVDAAGRVIFLHGVNARVNGVFDVTFADGRKELEPIPDFTADDVTAMRAMGFNSLRLPINWSGLEPVDGAGFDEAYLDRVAAVVALASAAKVSVLIDFHQDAYSKEIGEDGAPLWAIKPAPTKLLEGPLTDLDQRRTSAQVLNAFSTFFGDKSEGAALRTRFAAAVGHVAARFKGQDAVIGIEIMNEPLVNDDAYLDRLHDEVITAIRAADPGRLAFFEPNVVRNFLDRAPLAGRDPWPGTVYAPHVYTLAFSGSDEQRQEMTRATLEPSNKAARSEAKSWNAPLAVTEFGYGPEAIQSDNYLAWQLELQDQYQASGFFWVWKEDSQGAWGLFDRDQVKGAWTARDHVRKALSRVAPEAIAGWPESFGYDRAKKRFELKLTGDPAITAPSRIFVPAAADFAPSFDVTCDGAAITAAR